MMHVCCSTASLRSRSARVSTSTSAAVGVPTASAIGNRLRTAMIVDQPAGGADGAL
ncbi:hypothetical protein NKH45_29180 [Mesorhizobium sp. M1156]|uniref:hypothetical protein n=1 Tax=Mesorhizobium sp. M1156 TaxID=2957064 RepID=UPI0033355BD5